MASPSTHNYARADDLPNGSENSLKRETVVDQACKMRVAIICEYFYPDNSGSTPTDLSELSQSLTQSHTDLEISVFTSHNLYRPTGPIPKMARRENWNGVKIKRLRTLRSNRPSTLLRLLTGSLFSLTVLGHLIWKKPYDVVLIVTNPPTNAMTAWLYAKLRGVPYVYFINDLFPDVVAALGLMRESSLPIRLLRTLQRKWLHAAAKVVVVGRCMRSYIHLVYGVSEERIAVIRNWADPHQILPSCAENAFRKSNQLTGFVVLFGGNFSRYVNFNQILGAAELLAENHDISFVLIGDGAQRAEVIAQIQRRGLRNVRVLQPVPRSAMNEVLAASDVALIPLDPRLAGLGSPGKIYSILASGRPIIAIVSPKSEVAQIIEEERCGINVLDGDVSALTEGILRMRNDVEGRRQMAQNARRALEQRFTLQRATEEFYEVLRRALAGR
jgi:colanic acid biosynthesis glycosyl transferase WcaI